ncbi:hypothetical protein [Jiella marina]|uniref:hypothetical protein n=1 Tax=Jiella sp. LLJ827 TaxID=2917712 RepID=UPI0021018706|nr:hypothetical protein [Jiella sp. LLJ827]MCQ0986488.1 hypothetical protein [Jiella sp. LLJ827]
MSVIPFSPGCVRIDSGRCFGGDDPTMVGRWLFIVSVIDCDGGEITDYVGPDRDAADRAALSWARDLGVRLFDRSEEEPRQ